MTPRLRHKSWVLAVFAAFGILAFSGWVSAEPVGPLHKSEPKMQTHQYMVGEAAHIWPGTGGQEPVSQLEWTQFFSGPHDEIWDYLGARTEYFNTPTNPSIEDGTVTYGGRYGGGVVETVLWTPPDGLHDVPYSEFHSTTFNTLNPLIDPLANDDMSQLSDGNLTAGSWPNVGDDIVEGAHEEDLFFIHAVFEVLYRLYRHSDFNPSNDYLQDEFYNGLDYDAAEIFYYHLWRRRDHNDIDREMKGVNWYNSQSSWEEVIVMPDVFSPHPSPIQVAQAYWQLALDYYLGQNGRTQNTGLAYYFLGRIAHLLVDMTVPAHAHCDPHSPIWPDSYENFMGVSAHYSQYTHNRVPVFDAGGTVIGTEPWSYVVGDWPYKDFDYVRNQIPGTKWDFQEADDEVARNGWDLQSDLFRLFWCTAEIADNFDSEDAPGELDNGSRSAGGFSDFELWSMGNTLMPQAMISMAELYKLFQDTVAVEPLSRITLLTPSNESTLVSPPIFSWTPDGGTNNVFAVDLSLIYPMTNYWSTYENLGTLIPGATWSPSSALWNLIPPGSYVYWRVRGADLDQAPLSIVSSDEVWWFYKQ